MPHLFSGEGVPGARAICQSCHSVDNLLESNINFECILWRWDSFVNNEGGHVSV